MVRIEGKAILDGSGGVTDIDADDSPLSRNPKEFIPDPVELMVHLFKGGPSVAGPNGLSDRWIGLGEALVPHLNHRIGRGGDDQIYGLIFDLGHVLRIFEIKLMKCLHGESIFKVLENVQPIFRKFMVWIEEWIDYERSGNDSLS